MSIQLQTPKIQHILYLISELNQREQIELLKYLPTLPEREPVSKQDVSFVVDVKPRELPPELRNIPPVTDLLEFSVDWANDDPEQDDLFFAELRAYDPADSLESNGLPD